MCKSPNSSTINDSGAGVSPVVDNTQDPLRCQDPHQEEAYGSAITEEFLKRKNAELAALQTRLLSVPRSARRQLQKRAATLDQQIEALQADYAHSSEIMRAAVALSSSITTEDPDAIAVALERLVVAPLHDVALDEVALCYLIGASEGVVSSMQQHTSHAGVVNGACHALCNLFAGLQQLDGGAAMAQDLCSIEVGQVVVAAMDAHLTDRDVQFFGCRLINIVNIGMSTRSIAEASVEENILTACFTTSARVAVSKARRRHADDAEVTQWADCAMRLL